MFMVERRGHTSTRVITLPMKKPRTPRKALSNMFLWACGRVEGSHCHQSNKTIPGSAHDSFESLVCLGGKMFKDTMVILTLLGDGLQERCDPGEEAGPEVFRVWCLAPHSEAVHPHQRSKHAIHKPGREKRPFSTVLQSVVET